MWLPSVLRVVLMGWKHTQSPACVSVSVETVVTQQWAGLWIVSGERVRWPETYLMTWPILVGIGCGRRVVHFDGDDGPR